MPPKRKGAAAKGAGGKKSKVDSAASKKPAARGRKKKQEEEEPEPEEVEEPVSKSKDAINKLKAADAQTTKKGRRKVDQYYPIKEPHAEVYEDYDCMLNQTNIGGNNNKYYVIQVIKHGGMYTAFNRWGRVGEPGQNSRKSYPSADAAIKDFEKKFRDKTKNAWKDRANFSPCSGKYTLIEMDTEGGDDDDDGDVNAKLAKLDELDGVKSVQADCKLDKNTQELMRLIFDHDMFKEAMATMELDVKKMPLGKLSKSQIAKGFEVLEEIENTIETKSKKNLMDLSSKFYTIIPHSFGRQRPPVINTMEAVHKKYEMLAILGDIVIAQNIQKDAKNKSLTGGTKQLPHPSDVNYGSLSCDLEHIDKKTDEFKLLEAYTKNTSSSGWRNPTIKEIWKVNRHQEDERFAAHDDIDQRKLLWHGTNVAVVAAILKSGLRIMPHSGGRVGKGIYFASENSKSAGYVGLAGKTGIMFLTEVALGKEHGITRDDSSLKQAPKGFGCVVARGWTEPDPKDDEIIQIDGKDVVVPKGKPIKMNQYSGSSFSQSEYLVYKESQHRIRYLLKMSF